MPYNNTPIAPSQEVTGSCSLPLARIKKIIKADPDTGDCSNNAAFAISVATELFIQYLVEQTYTVVKTDHKKRGRNIQYRDIAGAVSKYDNLDFLADVCPQTITYKEYKQKKAATRGGAEDPAFTNGQRTLAFGKQKESADEMMADATDGAQDSTRSLPTSSPTAARHSYDAVRDSDDAGPRSSLNMEED